MNKFWKGLIFIASVIGILQSVWLLGLVIPVSYLSPMVLQTVQTTEMGVMIGVAVAVTVVMLAGILGIFVAILAPRRATHLNFYSQNGRLSISKKAVEKSLRAAVLAESPVTDAEVSTKITGKKHRATVRVSAVNQDKGDDLVQLGSQIQEIIERKLTSLMDVPVKKVKVNIQPFDARKKGRGQQPRVV